MIGGAIALPLVAGAGWLAARVWLPAWVSARVVRAVETRLGLPTRVDAVRVGLSEVEIIGLHVGDDQGVAPVWVHADRVVARVRPWAGLADIAGPDTAISVDALRVEAHRDHHQFDAWWNALRGGAATSDAKTGPRGRSPALSIGRASVIVRDERGIAIEAQLEELSYAERVFSAQLRTLNVGSAPGAVLGLRDMTVQLDRTDETLVMREVHVGGATIDLGMADGPSLRERLVKLLPRATKATPSDADETTWIDTLLSHVMQGTVVEWEQASVKHNGAVIVSGLKASAHMLRSDELLLEGTGHTTADGVVDWKLRVWPRQLRGEGNVDLDGVPLALLSPLLPRLPWHEVDRSRVDAQLVLQGEGVTRIGWSGRMTLNDAALMSARIAPLPVRLPAVSLEGRGHFVPSERRLEVVEGKVGLGRASATLQGVVEWTADHYLLDVSAALPRTPCDDVLSAIPVELLGEIASFKLSGMFASQLRVKIDSRVLADTVLDMGVQDQCDFLEVPALADLRRFTGPFMHYAVEPDETLFEMETGPGTAFWTPLEEISPLFVHAVLAHEDTQFFNHRGFSPQHIRGALVRNLEAGRYVLGASTISMQLVKNLLLRREKTLARKAQEVVLTWWVERMLDKRDILELYLNVIEYGPSVYGIRQASRYYFSREPSELSPAEATFLSTILPNPKAYHAFFEDNALSASWTERMRAQLQRMQARGWYAQETAQYGLNELKAFRFYPDGSVRMPSPTPMPTKTSLLPYQPGALLSNGLPTIDQLNFATIDGGE